MSLWSILTDQGRAEDVLHYYRFRYYVHGDPVISDAEYDELEAYMRGRWSVSAASHEVGSCRAEDYPVWIREGRRPMEHERQLRDEQIVERWLKNL